MHTVGYSGAHRDGLRVGVGVRVGVALGVWVRVGVELGVDVCVGVAVGLGVRVWVAVTVGPAGVFVGLAVVVGWMVVVRVGSGALLGGFSANGT